MSILETIKKSRTIKKSKSTIKVYLDMDGVIADFDEGVKLLTGLYPKEQLQQKMWSAIKKNEHQFWTYLPAMKDHLKLVKFLQSNFEHLMVLSSPGNGGQETINGKLDWLTNNGVHIAAIFRKDKAVYAEPNSLLIDDWSKNIEKWKQANGQTIHYTGWKQAKKELQQLLEKEDGVL